MAELSVIIPWVQEYPQVAFTVQNIFGELRNGEVDFEVICIENWCDEIAQQEPHPGQKRVRDKGFEYLSGLARINPWLKVLHYDKKLSHWQAKNLGVRSSGGKFLWFCDGHCIVYPGSVVRMLDYYRGHHKDLNGTLHLPLSYMLDAEGRELIYKLTGDVERGEVHYSFTRYRHSETVYKVPCMSTCGMMMTRELYDELGGWPTELGIYGGGENFINFTLAVLGKSVNIFPGRPLYHFADKRGYHWNFDDHLRNKTLAAYIYEGHEFAKLFIMNHRGHPLQKQKIFESIYTNPSLHEHAEYIWKKKVITIRDWVKSWKEKSP